MSSTTADAVCPATPLKLTSKRDCDVLDSTGSSPPAECPSEMTSPGGTINDSPVPPTPSPMAARIPMRRRGKTFSAISDASLGKHAIFSLTYAATEGTPSPTDSIKYMDSKTDQNLLHSSSNDSSGHQEESADVEGKNHMRAEPDGSTTGIQSLDSDSKDLARHGAPSACVFVANLAASQTDDQLMRSLQTHFCKFGKLHVKIRRDVKGNPYSFCQFETDESARHAVREGRNAIIDTTGRRIRCEPAKVNRTLVLTKHDGSSFGEGEARKILYGFGEREALEFSVDMYSVPVRGLKEGKRCFIRFAFRQDAVDVYQYFRFHGTFGVEWISNYTTTTSPVPRSQSVDIDPCSIFVGKLHPTVTDADLRNRFGQYGMIVDCNLLNRGNPGQCSFAFIKFNSDQSATTAIAQENNTQFLGNIIHVQKRELHKKPARQYSPPSGPRVGFQPMALPTRSLNSLNNAGASGPSFNITLKEVADLAARLAASLAREPDRRQSIVSNLSTSTGYNPMNFSQPQHNPSSRRGSYQSNMSGGAPIMFPPPFPQNPYAFSGSLPVSRDGPLSPITAQATLQGLDTQHEDRNAYEGSRHGLAAGGDRPQFTIPNYFARNEQPQGAQNDPYTTGFSLGSTQQQFSAPGFATSASSFVEPSSTGNRRDSAISSYDPLFCTPTGVMSQQPGAHMPPSYFAP